MRAIKTHLVTRDWFLQNTRPVYPTPKNWKSTIKYLMGDNNEAEIVNELISVLEAGKFRNPIVLDDEPKWGKYYVLDGTHRAVSYLLTESDSIEVAYSKDMVSDFDSDGPYSVLETNIEFTTELDEQMVDILFDVLRSFKLSDDEWLVSDAMFGHDSKSFNMMWGVKPSTAEKHEKINSLVTSRLNRFIGRDDFTVVTKVEVYDE